MHPTLFYEIVRCRQVNLSKNIPIFYETTINYFTTANMTRSKRSYDDCDGASGAPTEIDSYEYLKKVTSSGRTGILDISRVSQILLETCIFGMHIFQMMIIQSYQRTKDYNMIPFLRFMNNISSANVIKVYIGLYIHPTMFSVDILTSTDGTTA